MKAAARRKQKKTVSLYQPTEAPPQPAREADGTKLELREVRTDVEAVSTIRVRCRPGSFEWRYSRSSSNQFHAGCEFARAWERAGITLASPLLGDVKIGGGGWKGLPDARVKALDEVLRITREIGGPVTRRLVLYTVEGMTPKEIAKSYNVAERKMADVLDIDLIDLAKVMRYGG